jgi:hypothetical protein
VCAEGTERLLWMILHPGDLGMQEGLDLLAKLGRIRPVGQDANK